MTAEAPAPGPSRGTRRFRLARLAIAFGGLDRGVASLVSLIRIPLLVWGLELYQYGLYVAILGLAATAGLLDFGLHLGVLNAVAAARGRDDEASIRHTVATAFLLYSAIVVAAGAVIVPAVELLPIDRVLGIEPAQAPLARHVVYLAVASVLLPMPLKVFAVGLDGFQKQYATAIFRSVSNLVQLAVLAVAVVVFRGNLLVVAAVVVGGEVCHWTAFAFFAVRRQGELALHLTAASRALVSPLFRAGLLFFVSILANLLKLTLGSTIVSHGLGPSAVATFSVPLALYMTGYGVAGLVSTSFWPAYGEAAARGEWPWVERAFALSARTALGLAALFAVLGALLGEVVVDVWMPRSIVPSPALLGLLSVWLVAQTAVHAATNLLWGVDRVRLATAVVFTEGFAAFGLGLWLVGRAGVEGVAAAMVVSALASAAVLLLYAVPRATGGRVAVPWGAFVRLGACLVVAAAVGVPVRHALAGTPQLVLLGTGTLLTAAAFAVAAWWLALHAEERRRLRSWMGRLRRTP